MTFIIMYMRSQHHVTAHIFAQGYSLGALQSNVFTLGVPVLHTHEDAGICETHF